MKRPEEEGSVSQVTKSETLQRNIFWSDRSEEKQEKEKVMAIWRD